MFSALGTEIIAALAVAGLAILVRWVLLPFFWRDVPRLARIWTTSFQEKDIAYAETVHLSQTGPWVGGTITLMDQSKGATIYRFKGTFRNLILTATYASTDSGHYERGVFAIRYARGPDSRSKHIFRGQYVVFATGSDDFVSSGYEWHEG